MFYFQQEMVWDKQDSPCYLPFISQEASELNSPELPSVRSESLKNILFSARENKSFPVIGDEDRVFKNIKLLLFPATCILKEIVQ